MSNPPVSDLNTPDLIDRIRRGEFGREFLTVASRGLLPIEQDALVAVLAFLATNADTTIASNARASLAELPARVVENFARNDKADPEILGALSVATDNPAVLEALIRNRTTRDATILELARVTTPHLQEVIVINQERIIRTPAILDALLENPALSGDVRRRALETREEFFEKKSRIEAALASMEDETIALDAIADLLAAAEKMVDTEQTLRLPEGEQDPEKLSIFLAILNMSVSDKVRCAFRGGMTERGLLIRDRNRLVCTAVIRSPRITESEVESIAQMRNIEEEVLRIVSLSRQWMQKYPIAHALVRNPKAPIGVVLPLINRLTLRDLKNLSGDRNVPEVVRTSARKLYGQRKQT
jgi:hypothetical protein